MKSGANHLVQESRADFSKRHKQSAELEQLARFDLLSIEAILLKNVQAYLELRFSSEPEKEAAVLAVRKFVESHSRISIRELQIESVMQELMVNALARSRKCQDACRFRISFDDTSILLACWDAAGSSRRQTVLDQITRAFESSTSAQRELAFKIVVENSTDFLALCRTGKETVVASLVPVATSAAINTVPKNFHFRFIES